MKQATLTSENLMTTTRRTNAGAEGTCGTYAHTFHARNVVSACPTELFEYLDDPQLPGFLVPAGLSIPGCSGVKCMPDERQGRGVGARVRREGRFLGCRLVVDDEVEFYDRPRRKVWKTIGKPRLFAIRSARHNELPFHAWC